MSRRRFRIIGSLGVIYCVCFVTYESYHAYATTWIVGTILYSLAAGLFVVLGGIFYVPWALGYQAHWVGFRRNAGRS